MAPKIPTLFGSFDKLLNSGVFSSGPIGGGAGSRGDDWWLFLASGVALEGDGRVSHDLGASLPESAKRAQAHRSAPERVDVAWFRDVAPVGLSLPIKLKLRAPLSLGFVAGRSRNGVEEVYPFVLRASDDQLLVEFSANGPAPEIQRDIVIVFGARLLWRWD
jgi:hypothetical protein